MEIPLLNLKRQYMTIKDEIDDAIKGVVDNQAFVLSEEVTKLEEEIAAYCNTQYAVGVASGTDAILLALRAIGVAKGDLVITTPFTFFATAEVISMLGARPVFVDIDPGTYNIDPENMRQVLEAMDADTLKKVKAIIPVHLYGQCAEMDSIISIAEKYDLGIVEDCCQAIGSEYSDKGAGSFGIAGALSFFPSKNLGGFGDGGMIVTSDPSLKDEVRKLRVHGSDKTYIHESIGYNSRLDSLQAAILRVKLKKLDNWIAARRAIAKKYDKAFLSKGITIPAVSENIFHTYQNTISVNNRDEVVKALNETGVAARIYYPVPLHLQACYKGLGYSAGDFPVSEDASEKVLSIPIYPELKEEEIDFIITNVIKLI